MRNIRGLRPCRRRAIGNRRRPCGSVRARFQDSRQVVRSEKYRERERGREGEREREEGRNNRIDSWSRQGGIVVPEGGLLDEHIRDLGW